MNEVGEYLAAVERRAAEQTECRLCPAWVERCAHLDDAYVFMHRLSPEFEARHFSGVATWVVCHGWQPVEDVAHTWGHGNQSDYHWMCWPIDVHSQAVAMFEVKADELRRGVLLMPRDPRRKEVS